MQYEDDLRINYFKELSNNTFSFQLQKASQKCVSADVRTLKQTLFVVGPFSRNRATLSMFQKGAK